MYDLYSILLIVAIVEKEKTNNRFAVVLCKIKPINVVMIVHQMHYFTYFICDHIFLSMVPLILAINYNSRISAILWILTGFGEGTVFCIKKINDNLKLCNSNDWD